MSFGLVTEGITDQEVISNILYGYFNDPDLLINELQPLRDETDKKKSSNFGGWGNLIEYCKSDVFKYAFQTTNYVVIQIDTDICEEYEISKKEAGKDLTPKELIDKVTEMFVKHIGKDFYEKNKQRIIFAVAVHTIECWLLPLYYNNNKQSKTVGCLETLNQELSKKEGFTIDKNKKNLDYYREISKPFNKRKNLNLYYKKNPSFEVFINNLDVLQFENKLQDVQ